MKNEGVSPLITGLWEQDNTEYRLKPLTSKLLKTAETKLGVKLPDSYLAILHEQNGGAILYNAYPSAVPTAWGESFISVDHIRGIGKKDGILENAYLLKEWSLPVGLVLFSGDGHTWIAFDYRNAAVDPPVVYVDSESEQIMQIADSFKEFLSNLYIEQPTDDGEDDYAQKEYSEQDFEALAKQNNPEELQKALMQLTYSDVDMDWFGDQPLLLSSHANDEIRSEVAGIVWNNTYRLDDAKLHLLIKNFEKDADENVQLYAGMIKEKLDYPFEQLQKDVKLEGDASFLFQDKIYHVNKHSGHWHLSDSEEDFHSFSSLKELLADATINGKTLQELWSEVKKV